MQRSVNEGAVTSVKVGDVHVSKWATIWYQVVIRGEVNPVRVGHFSSIGDGSTIITSFSLPTGLPQSVNIGMRAPFRTCRQERDYWQLVFHPFVHHR